MPSLWSRLSLNWKIQLSFAFVNLLVIMVGVYTFTAKQSLIESFHPVYEITLPNVRNLGQQDRVIQEGQMLAELMLIERDPAKLRGHADAIRGLKEEFMKLDRAYRSVPFGPGEAEIYESYVSAWSAWMEHAAEFLKMTEAAKMEEARTFVLGPLHENHKTIQSRLGTLSDFHEKSAKIQVARVESISSTGNQVNVLMMVLSSIVISAIGFFLGRSLSSRLSAVSLQIDRAADYTRSTCGQLTSASEQLSSSSAKSASSLEETVASMEELTSMVKVNSESAAQASELSKLSRESAERGRGEMNELNEAMKSLTQSAKRIEEIIGVIDDVAFQTNLLALNAAVEAARAGEQGRGFAVVAEAVRTLAQKSALAAKDIADLIHENVQQTTAGAEKSNRSAKALDEIAAQIQKVAQLNQEIATASQEQTRGLTQINQAMNELDRVTQGNAASSEQVSASASEMAGQADQLVILVEELRKLTEGAGTPASSPSSSPAPSHRGAASWARAA